MTGFNIRMENYIHESILFVFPGGSDDSHYHKLLYLICQTLYLFRKTKR